MSKDRTPSAQLTRLRQALLTAQLTIETLNQQLRDRDLEWLSLEQENTRLNADWDLRLAERQVQDMQRENGRLQMENARLKSLT